MEDVAKMNCSRIRRTGLGGELDMAYSSNMEGLAPYTFDLGVERGVVGEPIAMSCDMNIGEFGIDPVDVVEGFWWRHWSECCREIEVSFNIQARLTCEGGLVVNLRVHLFGHLLGMNWCIIR